MTFSTRRGAYSASMRTVMTGAESFETAAVPSAQKQIVTVGNVSASAAPAAGTHAAWTA